MDPGSVAGVLVYENVWAAPFASAARRSGGQLIANGRIPIQAIIAAVEADDAPKHGETDMPPGQDAGRVGVVGAPVAKAAVVGAAVRPGPSPVAKAAVVGAAVTPADVAAASSGFPTARGRFAAPNDEHGARLMHFEDWMEVVVHGFDVVGVAGIAGTVTTTGPGTATAAVCMHHCLRRGVPGRPIRGIRRPASVGEPARR